MILFYNELTKISCLFIFSLFLAVIIIIFSYNEIILIKKTFLEKKQNPNFMNFIFSPLQQFDILPLFNFYFSYLKGLWTKNKEKITDFFLFFNIVLISTGCYYVTYVIKVKILILKLKDQISEIRTLIVLLDNHAQVLEKSLEHQAENRLIAAAVGLGIVILLGLLCFFFYGGRSGPGSDTASTIGDSFSSKSSEGSLSRVPSTTDLVTPTEVTVVENLVLQQEQLNQFQLGLDPILARAANTLVPTLSNWIEFSHKKSNLIEFSHKKILFFDESPTVRVGNSVIGWINTLEKSVQQIQNNNVSMEVLNSVDSTLSSITSILPHFLRQLDHFMEKANLSPDAAHHEFILESREIANLLLEKLVANETMLTGMVSGSIAFPEWFPGLICYFSMLNVVDNSGLLGIKGLIETVHTLLFYNNTTGTTAFLEYKHTLMEKLSAYYYEIKGFLDGTPERMSAIRYICVARTDDDFDNLIRLLIKLMKYHKSLGVNPSDIFLFL